MDHFYGKALTIDGESNNQKTLEVDGLEPHAEQIEVVDFVLIHTGWSQYWGTDGYFSCYPVLSLETANWLGNFSLKGMGVNTISVDQAGTNGYPVHKALFQKDIIIIENLKNLTALPSGPVRFACFPLHFTEADGSPVRAIAWIESRNY